MIIFTRSNVLCYLVESRPWHDATQQTYKYWANAGVILASTVCTGNGTKTTSLQFLNACHGRGSVGHMREITRPQPFQLKTKQVFGHIARARLIPLLKAPITI